MSGSDQGDRKLVEYFYDKIRTQARHLDQRLTEIGPQFRKQCERLAAKTRDPVLADYYRDHPDRIKREITRIRVLLRRREIQSADKALDHLHLEIQHIEQQLQQPFFRAADRLKRGGHESAKARAEDRGYTHAEVREAWERWRAAHPAASKGAADKAMARRFKISVRTVQTARAK